MFDEFGWMYSILSNKIFYLWWFQRNEIFNLLIQWCVVFIADLRKIKCTVTWLIQWCVVLVCDFRKIDCTVVWLYMYNVVLFPFEMKCTVVLLIKCCIISLWWF